MSDDLGVRPISVDILVTQSESGVAVRRATIEQALTLYNAKCEQLRTELTEAETTQRFLQQEYDNVVLVQQLQAGTLVRVVCSTCKGSGLKATDVLSGQIHRKSAFESVGETVVPIKSPLEVPAKDRCPACEGKRYLLMERYCG